VNGYPDLEYIKTEIPVTAIARDLGLYVNGYRARCWRTEYHRNGDSDPSVGFQKAKNRYRCFVCDAYSGSNIDLVMAVRDVEIRLGGNAPEDYGSGFLHSL
jgi:hypothetical protein